MANVTATRASDLFEDEGKRGERGPLRMLRAVCATATNARHGHRSHSSQPRARRLIQERRKPALVGPRRWL